MPVHARQMACPGHLDQHRRGREPVEDGKSPPGENLDDGGFRGGRRKRHGGQFTGSHAGLDRVFWPRKAGLANIDLGGGGP